MSKKPPDPDNLPDPGDFSEEYFWKKLRRYAKTVGKEIVEKALILFYAAKDPNTPAWAKAVILSALAYFVFPVDAIPDFIPVVGYADDLTVLAGALGVVAFHITEDHKKKAKEKLRDWFGD